MTTASELKILHRYFNASKHGSIGELIRSTKTELTAETYAAVILRHKTPATRSLMIMAADLNIPKEELVRMLQARGEHTLARMIDPRPVTQAESVLLERFRSIADDPHKVKLVMDLLGTITK